MRKVRTWFKRTPIGSFFWKFIIGLIGGGLTIIGALALIAPGPGVLIILTGLGILASEFTWAGEVLLYTKKVASSTGKKVKDSKWIKDFLIASILILLMFAILLYYMIKK